MFLFTGVPKRSYTILKQWSKFENFETVRLAVMSLTYDEKICLKSCIRILDLNALKVFSGLKSDYQALKLIFKNDRYSDLTEKYANVDKQIYINITNILKSIEHAEFRKMGELSGENFNKSRRHLLEYSNTNMNFQGLSTPEKQNLKNHLNTIIDGLERVEKVFQNVRDLLKMELNYTN